MGLIEVILTVVAWKRGWRWLALLPFVVCLAAGIIWGLVLVANGHTSMPSNITPVAVIPDVFAIVALIVMIVKKRVPPNTPNQPNLSLNPPN